eukprot:m.42937 g.42937  ORF g.42937 m.42937 type:complete len:450 (+) comp8374_c0_seq2:151-1500(+)
MRVSRVFPQFRLRDGSRGNVTVIGPVFLNSTLCTGSSGVVMPAPPWCCTTEYSCEAVEIPLKVRVWRGPEEKQPRISYSLEKVPHHYVGPLRFMLREAASVWETLVPVFFQESSLNPHFRVVLRRSTSFASAFFPTDFQNGKSCELSITPELLSMKNRAWAVSSLAHELGHVLGLPHSSFSEDVMYPDPRWSSPSQLSHRESGLIRRMYGILPPDPNSAGRGEVVVGTYLPTQLSPEFLGDVTPQTINAGTPPKALSGWSKTSLPSPYPGQTCIEVKSFNPMPQTDSFRDGHSQNPGNPLCTPSQKSSRSFLSFWHSKKKKRPNPDVAFHEGVGAIEGLDSSLKALVDLDGGAPIFHPEGCPTEPFLRVSLKPPFSLINMKGEKVFPLHRRVYEEGSKLLVFEGENPDMGSARLVLAPGVPNEVETPTVSGSLFFGIRRNFSRYKYISK